jgi:hypothetical protein
LNIEKIQSTFGVTFFTQQFLHPPKTIYLMSAGNVSQSDSRAASMATAAQSQQSAAAAAAAGIKKRNSNNNATAIIPLTVATADGARLYVLENEAYHSGSRHSGGRTGGAVSSSGRSPKLPEMTASLADFSVINKEECQQPRKAKIDESEWVVVPNA